MSRWWSVVGLVVLLFGQVTCPPAVAEETPFAAGDVASKTSASGAAAGIDLFARLRTTQFGASDQYWQQFGHALSRMAKLEGASYDPASGAVLLVGQPAESFGPYDLDDLMVVLKAKLFHREPLGMTIDPDPADPHGPKQLVRYFAGSQDTACGWIMFECDRLLKCYSQGSDNLTGEPMDPELEGFGTMLQRAAASKRLPRRDRWNRFWLDVDIHDHKAGAQPTKSNGTQPVARVTSDGFSIRLMHCRVYLRTEMMNLAGGEFVRATGEKSPEAEQFAIHFSNHYEQYARLHPEFAQLEAISHLCALSDWLIARQIPLDVNYIAAYRQRVPVVTPTWTPAITAELNVATPLRSGIQQARIQAIGGVSLTAKLFQAEDDGSAQKLGEAVRNGQTAHWNDVAWRQTDADGQPQFVVAMPTLNTRFRRSEVRATTVVELRKSDGQQTSPPADLPSGSPLADSDRSVSIPNVQISVAALREYRVQQPRAPPDVVERRLADADRSLDILRPDIPLARSAESDPNTMPRPPDVLLGDERHLAAADRSLEIFRPDIPLARSAESDPNVMPRPPDPERAGPSPGLSQDTPFRPEADRDESNPLRVEVPLHSPTAEPYAPRPPPDQFRADAERTPLDNRQAVPLAPRSEVRQLGLTVFETTSGARTLNWPKLVRWKNPSGERHMSVQGVPGTAIVVADQLALVSELGDIMVRFGEPEIDQVRAQLYYPTEPPGQAGIQGYYPQARTLSFDDGARIEFDTAGSPQRVTTAHGTTVAFQYVSVTRDAGQPAWPLPEKCTVLASSAEADSGEFTLFSSNPGPSVSDSSTAPEGPGFGDRTRSSGDSGPLDHPASLEGQAAGQVPQAPPVEESASGPLEASTTVPSTVETSDSGTATFGPPAPTPPVPVGKPKGANPAVWLALFGMAIVALLLFFFLQANQ